MSKRAPRRIKVNGSVYVRADVFDASEAIRKNMEGDRSHFGPDYISSDEYFDALDAMGREEMEKTKQTLGRMASVFKKQVQPLEYYDPKFFQSLQWLSETAKQFQAEVDELSKKMKALDKERIRGVQLMRETIFPKVDPVKKHIVEQDGAEADEDTKRWVDYARQWVSPPYTKRPWD